MPVFSSFCLRGSALDGSLKVATVTMFITGHYTALIQNQPSRRPVCACSGFVLTTGPGRPSYDCEPELSCNLKNRKDANEILFMLPVDGCPRHPADPHHNSFAH